MTAMKNNTMHKITLFDANCPSAYSGVVCFYTNNIDRFTKQWMKLETGEDVKERFTRSLNGEIVTDYYSDDPSLNIVQKDSDSITYFERIIAYRNKWVKVYNAYNYASDIHFNRLILKIKYVKFQGELLRLVTYKAYGVAQKSLKLFGSTEKYNAVNCYGNPVLINKKQYNKHSNNISDYENNKITFIAYTNLGCFKSLKEMKKDYKHPKISKEQLSMLLCDIVGEAG